MDLNLDELDELLDAEVEAEEPQDPRNIIPFSPKPREGRSGRGGEGKEKESQDIWEKMTPPFKKGEVLWILQVQSRDDRDEQRPVTEQDLARSIEDFDEAREFISPRFCVLKQKMCSDKKKGANFFAMVLPVYDRRSVKVDKARLKPEKVGKKFLFRYERIYTKNETILEAFKRSVRPMMGRHDVRALVDSVYKQHDDVKEYFRKQEENGAIDPLEYLPLDIAERHMYLVRLEVNDPKGLSYLNCSSTTNNDEVEEEQEQEQEQEEVVEVKGQDDEVEVILTAEKNRRRWDVDSDDEDDDQACCAKPSDLNVAVLKYFRRGPVQRRLGKFVSGEAKSERHREMTERATYKLGLGSTLSSVVNNDYLDHDMTTEKKLYELIVDKVFEPTKSELRVAGRRRKSHPAHFVKDYVFYCLLPEGILMYLREKRGLSSEEAETEYLTNSSSRRRKKQRLQEENGKHVAAKEPSPAV